MTHSKNCFHAALETVVEIANMRSTMLSTSDQVRKELAGTKEWQQKVLYNPIAWNSDASPPPKKKKNTNRLYLWIIGRQWAAAS